MEHMEKQIIDQDNKCELCETEQDWCHHEMMMGRVVPLQKVKDNVQKKVEVRAESPTQLIEDIHKVEDMSDNGNNTHYQVEAEISRHVM
eukprot:1992052-Ditylum_brightwellii.AAC.1